MIRELYIENFILIEKTNIKFKNGLNIVTGETGAGKSIVLNAINIVVGDLAKTDFIRENEDLAIIEATFDVNDKVKKILEENGIYSDDKFITVTREIHSNKINVARINGRRVNVKLISQIGDYLIDFHGQHEHQSLLKVSNHLKYLDNFCNNKIVNELEELKKIFKDYHALKEELYELKKLNDGKDREVDLIKYELNEINAANIEDGEFEKLKNRYNYLKNLDDIRNTVEKSIAYLSDDDEIFDQLSELKYDFENIKEFDDQLSDIYNEIKNILFLVENITDIIREYSYELDYSDDELKKIENRLDLLNNLMRKYGDSIQEIKEYEDNLEEKLNTYENIENDIEKAEKEISKLKDSYYHVADQLSNIRKKQAKIFEKNLSEEFEELNLKDAELKIEFNEKNEIAEEGKDEVEFLISTNFGQSFHKLKDIVSGGELSRIMLAIKLVVKEINDVSTLIFDEVDSGISGYTANIVGKKLKKISNEYQVVAITHLPQIAVYADHHISIEKIKDLNNNTTKTTINILNDEDKKYEIAKLISGDDITQKALNNAVELLDRAQKYS